MKKNVLIVIAQTALAFSLVDCSSRTEALPASAANDKAVSVETIEVNLEDVQRTVEVTGTLAPWEEAVVSLEAEGRLVKVAVDLGDPVRKGQMLALIAPQEYEYKKVQAEAELAAAEADFKRTQDLAKKEMSTPQQLDENRRRLEVARTAADLARKKVADTSLIAPIDGMVSKRLINVGEYVRIGTPAFQIVRTTPLKLKADVPERYVSNVTIGSAVTVEYEALRDKPLTGTVVRVSPIVAVDSRSFPIEAQIENPKGSVKPGTFARASVMIAKPEKALVVPEAAVASFAGTPRVYVFQDGKAHERVIEVSGKNKGRFIVTKGLSQGEKVIVTGLESLADGRPVVAR
jgi:membrane fusion protein (multidrug efflux system)